MRSEDFWQLSVFDEVDSTNTRIKEAIAQNAPEGTCFAAHRQTAAYGRQGRSWSSPEGGLYFSFLLDPLGASSERPIAQAQIPSLSLAVSLGVQATLAGFAATDAIKIKWPNDILVLNGEEIAKLCGISLELIQGKVCCGVGINMVPPQSSSDEALTKGEAARYERAYLIDLIPQAKQAVKARDLFEVLLPELLSSIFSFYRQWLQEGIAPLISRYDQLLFNRGKQVALETVEGDLVCEGEVQGVSLAGELLLRTKEGNIIAANSGEVHTRLER